MTSEIFLLNAFFAYFFNVGFHLRAVFLVFLVTVLVVTFIKKFLLDSNRE